MFSVYDLLYSFSFLILPLLYRQTDTSFSNLPLSLITRREHSCINSNEIGLDVNSIYTIVCKINEL